MNIRMVDLLVGRYVCAVCWGTVTTTYRNGEVVPVCARSLFGECDGAGFVTRNYADRRRGESAAELAEVKMNYPDLFGAREKRSEQQLLKELGF